MVVATNLNGNDDSMGGKQITNQHNQSNSIRKCTHDLRMRVTCSMYKYIHVIITHICHQNKL